MTTPKCTCGYSKGSQLVACWECDACHTFTPADVDIEDVIRQRDALLEAAKKTSRACKDLNLDIRYLVYADNLDKAIRVCEPHDKEVE